MTAPVTGTSATAQGAAATPGQAQLRQAAQAFEAIFLRQMIGSMRQAKLSDDMLGSTAGDQFQEMADANLADSMAAQRRFGIADMLVRQFTHASPAAPGAAAATTPAPQGNGQ